MSRVLPKELKTKKVKSLQGNLRDIAEELIAKKFDIEEEVVRKPAESFLGWDMGQGMPETYYGTSDGSAYVHRFSERQRGYQDEIHVESRPWDRRRIASLRVRNPSLTGLMRARKRFGMENIGPDMKFVMDKQFLNELLLSEHEFRYYFKHSMRSCREGEENVAGQIMGVDVVLTPAINGCVLEATF